MSLSSLMNDSQNASQLIRDRVSMLKCTELKCTKREEHLFLAGSL